MIDRKAASRSRSPSLICRKIDKLPQRFWQSFKSGSSPLGSEVMVLDRNERRESVWTKIKADINHYATKESTGISLGFVLRMVAFTPGFQFVLSRRIQEAVVKIPVIGRPLRRILWWATCLVFGSELAMGAEIAGGLYTPHPYGIVVGAAKLGANVSILQNVTIGRRAAGHPGDPILEAGVDVSAGAVIVGAVTIGEGATIGANAVVLKDVPQHSMALGVPAKIVAKQRDLAHQAAL